MIIKILGTGCSNCNTLGQRVQKVVDDNKIEAEIIKVEDLMEIMEYNVMATPGLIVNEEIKSKGRIPSEAEIKDFLLN